MIYTTGHHIADTVARFLPDGDYGIAYGILRGTPEKLRSHEHWFEVDKGFWNAQHFDGNYRLSYKGTQPLYTPLDCEEYARYFEPWRGGTYSLICPPTQAVCEFFGIDQSKWIVDAVKDEPHIIRHKGDNSLIWWDKIGKLVTFNSTIAVEALKRGIPVISDPDHSTVGSWNKSVDAGDRHKLFSFMQASQFKLTDKGDICRIIQRYL